MGLEVICDPLHFFGRAYRRWFKSRIPAYGFDPTTKRCVRNVLKIPRQQIIYTVGGGNRNVEGIARLGRRYRIGNQESSRERIRGRRAVEQCDVLDDL